MRGVAVNAASRNEDWSLGWYFSGLRMVVTVPLLLLMGLNVVYHMVMMALLQVDLFIGNFLLWLLFGELLLGTVAWLAIVASMLPIGLLPMLWDTPRIWGIGKIGIFVIGLAGSAVVAGLISVVALRILNAVAGLRTTLWWAELWGVAG